MDTAFLDAPTTEWLRIHREHRMLRTAALAPMSTTAAGTASTASTTSVMKKHYAPVIRDCFVDSSPVFFSYPPETSSTITITIPRCDHRLRISEAVLRVKSEHWLRSVGIDDPRNFEFFDPLAREAVFRCRLEQNHGGSCSF